MHKQILDKGRKVEHLENEFKPLNFEKAIKLENMSFQYNKDLPNILNKFNYEIKKGEKIAIKGQTGSGKSTLVNIISGARMTSKIYPKSPIIHSR